MLWAVLVFNKLMGMLMGPGQKNVRAEKCVGRKMCGQKNKTNG
jgi:hypothetical protein